jgi:hypothetical protein
LLNNAAIAPMSADIGAATLAFQDFLKVRGDTSMFRLRTGSAVNACVTFPDQAGQADGLIVMRISGASGCGDSKYKSIVVLFNANRIAQSFAPAGYANKTTIALHPVQLGGSDAVAKGASFNSTTGIFSVPARTTAVFVEQ